MHRSLLLSLLALAAIACGDPEPPPEPAPIEDTRPSEGESCIGMVGVCQGQNVVCIDNVCRSGCGREVDGPCADGLACQRVDLRIEVGSGASAIEEGFDLCLPEREE